MKISIIYWSGSGNTESMAKYIAEGATEAGAITSVKTVGTASEDDVATADILAFGCPAMGEEVLEESEFQPFIDSIINVCKNKKIALFGSYGWGDGRWMREWQEKMQAAGSILLGTGFIVQGEPTGPECKEFGKTIATS